MSNIVSRRKRMQKKQGTQHRKKSQLKQSSGSKQVDGAIMELWNDAKAQGYDSVKDYLKAQFKDWDGTQDRLVLDELYTGFISSVGEGVSKEPWGLGNWHTSSTFEEYLLYCEKEIETRIEELTWKIKSQYPAYGGMVQFLPDMTNVPAGVGEGLSREDYELYDMLLHKTQELIKNTRTNPERLHKYLMDAETERKAVGDIPGR